MKVPQEIVIATGNAGKAKETRKILSVLPLRFLTLQDFPTITLPAETGKSFAENALIKARHVALYSCKASLADDSGLCVDYLAGKPGIRSARFAGRDANDRQRNEKVLEALNGVPFEKRTARFVCCVALVFECGNWVVFTGRLNGYITEKIIGDDGFGYDPIFYLPEYGLTLAQVGEKKNRISHRAKALKALVEYLTGPKI